jgi:hypothetical protein
VGVPFIKLLPEVFHPLFEITAMDDAADQHPHLQTPILHLLSIPSQSFYNKIAPI